MKRILFVSSFKGVGGTEISLLNLLKQLNKDQVQVDLALIGEQGPLTSKIPEWVRIIPITVKSPKEYVLSKLKKGNIPESIKGIIRYIRLQRNRKRTHAITMYQYEHMLYLYSKVDEEYDAAITWYLPNSVHTAFTVFNTNAKRKVMWIHMDVSMDRLPEDSERVLLSYDRIYCVSKACKQIFDEKYPSCQGKTEVYYNVIDCNMIKEAGLLPAPMIDKSKFCLATSGRLHSEKQPLFAIKITEKLLQDGITDFIWYFIGDGVLRHDMEEEIKKKRLQNNIVLLGHLDNPFAYVDKCDLYVQMSRHEAFGLTLAETQILGIPSISTNFPSAYEIVENGNTGIIVSNSCEAIADAIKHVMNDRECLAEMRKALKSHKMHCIGSPQQLLSYVYEEN